MTEHAERLLARLGDQGTTLAAEPQLAGLLDGLFDRAEGRLPHRPIRRDALIERIADALLASGEPPDREALSRLNAADLYVALALAAGDVRALAIAESELIPLVRQAVGRVDPSPRFIDEVSERVRERLLGGDAAAPPAIVHYRGTGPLARWVRVIAGRIALDLRREYADLCGEPEPAPVPVPCDPELEVMWRACADEYEAALAGAFTSLPPRDRNLLRQRYLDELNLDALGLMYRVSPSMTSYWLKQIEERLAAATCTALRARLAIDEAQLHGVARLVESRLPHSISRLLRGDEPGGGTQER